MLVILLLSCHSINPEEYDAFDVVHRVNDKTRRDIFTDSTALAANTALVREDTVLSFAKNHAGVNVVNLLIKCKSDSCVQELKRLKAGARFTMIGTSHALPCPVLDTKNSRVFFIDRLVYNDSYNNDWVYLKSYIDLKTRQED